jgi:hypothetical protein
MERTSPERHISLTEMPLWSWLVAALLFTLFTLLSASAALLTPVLGQVSQVTDYLPELAHDGRHLLAVACH